ncbi:FecR family protein [Paenibacillus sp. PL2-23]|uniref:FecR family protein n=1 Tax=Paenibacillus sp. PL2-23 TaxID=2100729 RepID=UPI0030F91CE4
MKGLRVVLVLALLLSLIGPVSALAKNTAMAGKVTAVSGKSEVKKSGGSKKFSAFKGMAIGQGDTIMTGAGAKLTMELGSDKEVVFGANTTLTVSELVKSAKAMGGKTSLSLQKGSVLIKIKQKLSGDSSFGIETPTSIMGVMGTEFTVSYEEGRSYVGVFEGGVWTRYGEDGDNEEIVEPDQELWIEKDGNGEVQDLRPESLPLVALEDFEERLQAGGGNEALLKRVQDLLAQKRAAEAEAAKREEEKQKAQKSTIIYEKATPAPAPTPVPGTGTQPTPPPPPAGAPEFDADAFYGDIYSYLLDNRTISVPFTTEIGLNVDNSSEHFNWGSVISVMRNPSSECYECSSESIEQVVVAGNELVITLDESSALNYWDYVTITIASDVLYNKNYPNDVQESEVVVQREEDTEGQLPLLSNNNEINLFVVEESDYVDCYYMVDNGQPQEGFCFFIEHNPASIEFSMTQGTLTGFTEMMFPSFLGYAENPADIIPEFSGSQQQNVTLTEDDYVWEEVEGGWKLRISNAFLYTQLNDYTESESEYYYYLVVPINITEEVILYIEVEKLYPHV